MTNYPTGYDPSGLAPKLEILDKDDNSLYIFESEQIAADPDNPDEDFILESWDLERGVNTNLGSMTLNLEDDNKDLIDLLDIRRPVKIKNGYKLKCWLGKDYDNLNLWFKGMLATGAPLYDSPNTTNIRLFAVGNGIKLSDYKTIMRYFMKKDSGGEDIDKTDTTGWLSEIIKRLVTKTDHYPMPISSMGFTANAVQDIPIFIPDVQYDFQSIAAAIQELANWGAAYYGVEPDDDFFLRLRDGSSSKFLVTNDFGDVLTDNWNQDKICFLQQVPRWYQDEITEYGYSFFNGLKAMKPSIDVEQTSSDGILDLSLKYYAFPFDTGRDTLLKVAMYLSKAAAPNDTPSKDMTIRIIGEDGAAAPNSDDERMKKIIPAGRLQDELDTARFLEASFNKIQVTPREKLFLEILKYGDATNYVGIDYQTGSGTYYDSSDGSSWTSRTGDVKFRTYAGKSVNVICENTIARKAFGDRQMNVPLSGFKSIDTALTALAGIAESRGKQRRTYPTLLVDPPTEPLQLGKTLQVIDVRSGIKINPNLIHYHLGGSAFDPVNNLGAKRVELTIEEWSY